MRPIAIKDLLAEKLKRKALGQAYVMGVCQKVIDKRAKVVSLKAGVLKVVASDQVAGFRLAIEPRTIIDQANQILGEEKITKLKVVIGH